MLAGQGWVQVGELALALVLSTAIGIEREIRQKSAGLRTHALVGFASALIMLVSKYGFGDILGDHVALDPSRIAAQIVSGIGFIGGGLIFVRRDAVRGLTTAATIWLTAGIGMAAGAGLWLIAVLATAGHFVVVLALTPLSYRLPRSKYAPTRLRLSYVDHQGTLRQALALCTDRNFTVTELSIEQPEVAGSGPVDDRIVTVWLSVRGGDDVTGLVTALAGVEGMVAVAHDDPDASV